MNSGRTVFSQLISFLPDREFRRCVARYGGDRRLREFSCWDQYLTMAFARLTYRESLRDIEACLRSLQGKLYHLGFRGHVSRSTLADANENRDWRVFADFAQVLIGIARPLYAHDPMASISSKVSTPWTPPRSISASRCFRGLDSASTRPPSRCTRCSTFTATSPPLSALQRANCTM